MVACSNNSAASASKAARSAAGSVSARCSAAIARWTNTGRTRLTSARPAPLTSVTDSRFAARNSPDGPSAGISIGAQPVISTRPR